MGLEDRVAVVTGGGRGIGRAIALALAGDGARVVVGDIDVEAAQETVSAIEALGSQGVAEKADVTRKADAERLVQAAVDAFGRLDIAVNNAGIYPSAPITEMKEEDWDLVVDVNLKGVFLCSQAVVRQMISQGDGGTVINISSVDAKTRTTGNAHYSAAKAGVISFTRSLACEMIPHGIRSNAVAPGWIKTETLVGKSDRWRDAVKEIPTGRLGKPEDVAQAVLFLVSDSATYINGEVLDVNGGLVMD